MDLVADLGPGRVAGVFQAETIRAAQRCGRPDCSCRRGKQVHCPGHADKNPSLSVEQRKGVVLVHCFAGCSQERVIDSLRELGLWAAARGPQRVRSGGILLKVAKFIEQYVTLPSQETDIALALWVAHTWALDAFEVSPYLVITSPEKRSGKTRLLEVLEQLVPRPWRVVQPSEAVLFRKVSKDRPVLLLDEADAIFAGERRDHHEPLRAVLMPASAAASWCRGVSEKVRGRSSWISRFSVQRPSPPSATCQTLSKTGQS